MIAVASPSAHESERDPVVRGACAVSADWFAGSAASAGSAMPHLPGPEVLRQRVERPLRSPASASCCVRPPRRLRAFFAVAASVPAVPVVERDVQLRRRPRGSTRRRCRTSPAAPRRRRGAEHGLVLGHRVHERFTFGRLRRSRRSRTRRRCRWCRTRRRQRPRDDVHSWSHRFSSRFRGNHSSRRRRRRSPPIGHRATGRVGVERLVRVCPARRSRWPTLLDLDGEVRLPAAQRAEVVGGEVVVAFVEPCRSLATRPATAAG